MNLDLNGFSPTFRSHFGALSLGCQDAQLFPFSFVPAYLTEDGASSHVSAVGLFFCSVLILLLWSHDLSNMAAALAGLRWEFDPFILVLLP